MKEISSYVIEKLKLGKDTHVDEDFKWYELAEDYKLKMIKQTIKPNDYQFIYKQPADIINKVKTICSNWNKNYKKIENYFNTINNDNIMLEAMSKSNNVNVISLFLYTDNNAVKHYDGLMTISKSEEDNSVTITTYNKNTLNLFAEIYKYMIDNLQ